MAKQSTTSRKQPADSGKSRNGRDVSSYEQELSEYLQQRIKPGLNRGAIPLLARSIAKELAHRAPPEVAEDDVDSASTDDFDDETEAEAAAGEDSDEETEAEATAEEGSDEETEAETDDDFDDESEAEADDDFDDEDEDGPEAEAEADDDVDEEDEDEDQPEAEADDDDVDDEDEDQPEAEADDDVDEEDEDEDQPEAEADDDFDEDDDQAADGGEAPDFEADMHDLQAELGEDWILRFSVHGEDTWLTAEKEDGSQHVEAPTASVLAEVVDVLNENGGRSS